jgi:hypothetical protein
MVMTDTNIRCLSQNMSVLSLWNLTTSIYSHAGKAGEQCLNGNFGRRRKISRSPKLAVELVRLAVTSLYIFETTQE